jgi:hypothetical protein
MIITGLVGALIPSSYKWYVPPYLYFFFPAHSLLGACMRLDVSL